MAEDSLQRASFVRTDENGLLEFRVDDGRLICVEVTDELERGIIESKQIVAELKGTPSPHSEKALPISTIQTLLRAGEDPADVAKEYNIGEPLVRRFAKPVEIEKKYQIDQFRHSHMPGSTIPHETVESALQSQLLQSGVRFTDVAWSATRHGRDPWRILASFPQSGRTYTAEWSFDTIHGNITCLDQVSKRLFSRTQATAAPTEEESAVQASAEHDDDAPSRAAGAAQAQGAGSAAPHDGASMGTPNVPVEDDIVRRGGRLAAQDTAAEASAPISDAHSASVVQGAGPRSSQASSQTTDDAQTERIPATGENPASPFPATAGAAGSEATGSAAPSQQAQQAQPKKQRPVFRKWDDIIFGE